MLEVDLFVHNYVKYPSVNNIDHIYYVNMLFLIFDSLDGGGGGYIYDIIY